MWISRGKRYRVRTAEESKVCHPNLHRINCKLQATLAVQLSLFQGWKQRERRGRVRRRHPTILAGSNEKRGCSIRNDWKSWWARASAFGGYYSRAFKWTCGSFINPFSLTFHKYINSTILNVSRASHSVSSLLQTNTLLIPSWPRLTPWRMTSKRLIRCLMTVRKSLTVRYISNNFSNKVPKVSRTQCERVKISGLQHRVEWG